MQGAHADIWWKMGDDYDDDDADDHDDGDFNNDDDDADDDALRQMFARCSDIKEIPAHSCNSLFCSTV